LVTTYSSLRGGAALVESSVPFVLYRPLADEMSLNVEQVRFRGVQVHPVMSKSFALQEANHSDFHE